MNSSMPPSPAMSFGLCPGCGYSHPPIPAGTICPASKEKTKDGNVIEYDDFFKSLKNILSSQIQTKNIKDTKKFLGNILVMITKLCEDYKG